MTHTSTLTDSQRQSFHDNGYLILESFLQDSDIDAMLQEIRTLFENEEKNSEQSNDSQRTFTGNSQKNNQNAHDFFMTSSDKIRFFLEKDASKVNPNEPAIWKYNKVGHALHDKSEVFKKVSFQGRIRDIAVDLMKYEDPRIVQSMYIFKPPRVGGEVTPHQDDSYVSSVDPERPCIGFWMALEDAHRDNACLWAIPGSHKPGTRTRWVQRALLTDEERKKLLGDPEDPSPMGFIMLNEENSYFSDEYADKYVPLEVKKGSVVLLHGRVMHQSFPNVSKDSREAYTLHLVDKDQYCKTNWLQRDDGFPSYWE